MLSDFLMQSLVLPRTLQRTYMTRSFTRELRFSSSDAQAAPRSAIKRVRLDDEDLRQDPISKIDMRVSVRTFQSSFLLIILLGTPTAIFEGLRGARYKQLLSSCRRIGGRRYASCAQGYYGNPLITGHFTVT